MSYFDGFGCWLIFAMNGMASISINHNCNLYFLVGTSIMARFDGYNQASQGLEQSGKKNGYYVMDILMV